MIFMMMTTTFSTIEARSGCTKDDSSYDYFLLVQQWPATQNSGSWPEGANTSDFSLHGLWPSRVGSDSASYPCECTEESFDESKVSDLLTRMETNWASYTGQNQQFWSHEWSKHGTCSTPFLGNQHDYFSNALDARVKTTLLTMLSRSNIVPDSTKTYTSADISSAVGHAPALGCKGSKLSEIAVCLSKDDLSRQDCDPSVLSNRGEFNDCPETGIIIPSSASPSPSPSGKCADYGCGGVYDPTRPCQCTSTCGSHDDCCPDYDAVCGGGSNSTCVAGQHGPSCTTDAECLKYSKCVRCASSGYCTCVDKSTGRCA